MTILRKDAKDIGHNIEQLQALYGNIAAENHFVHTLDTGELLALQQYFGKEITVRKATRNREDSTLMQYIHWQSLVVIELMRRGVID